MSRQLEQTGEPQISTSDPESRQLMTRNNISEVAYNVQTVVDAKHYLPIDYKVTNENDTRALSGMLRRANIILGTPNFTALYDKGYHTGSEIKKAVTSGIQIMVAIPAIASVAPDENYNMSHFTYDQINDTYTCPQNRVLTTNGNYYQKSKNGYSYAAKHYKTNRCHSCPAKALCTISIKGRLIVRTEFAEYVEQNRLNIEADPATYKKRQSIVEHPYGTIKRQWGYYYVITKKGMKRASADVGFMFTAYNLRRLINIIDKSLLKKYLQELALFFSKILPSIKAIIFKIRPSLFYTCVSQNILLAP